MDEDNQLSRLEEKLRKLETELQLLKVELSAYRSQTVSREKVIQPKEEAIPAIVEPVRIVQEKRPEPAVIKEPPGAAKTKSEFSWEQFVGEQLLSKIGILILVAGLIIGAKIAIDKNLIGAGMKVFGGFLVSGVLFFFAWRFREKYRSFSAVLFAGSMAAAYFISYAGFVFYHLYPYWLAFLLLLVFTSMTVAGALRYNLVVIAQIGLLAAYILPGIIAVKSAHLSSYLAYMAVINAGILVVSVLRSWKSLTYTALGWTFMVMLVWFCTSYKPLSDYVIAMSYSLVYLVLFHVSALANTFYEKRAFQPADLWIAIPNMALWLIAANGALASADSTRGMHFSLLCLVAVFYGLLALYFRQFRRTELFPFRTHIALALSVMTLGLMVRINGENLYLVLTIEAILFSWLAIASKWKSLHVFSLILLLITCITGLMIVTFWESGYDRLLTGTFVKIIIGSGTLLAGGLFLSRKYKEPLKGQSLNYMLVIALSQLFLFVNVRFIDSYENAIGFQLAVGFSLAMLASLRFIFTFDEKSMAALQGFLVAGTILLIVTGTTLLPYARLIPVYVFGHYLVLASAAAIVYWMLSFKERGNLYVFAQLMILWGISYELLFWLNSFGSDKGYKLLLSLIWTSYAIFLIYSGIRKRIAGLRVSGMIILGITILKLFFYDLSRLSGISKTLVMMAIGGLLLLGAFFYQRFMKEEENEGKL